ncbi:MAG: DUF3445 domain-containing protein [Pseudomonadota bacterium]
MILLKHAPYAPFLSRRTRHPPGLSPLKLADWTVQHADFAAQMAYRGSLMKEKRDVVLADDDTEAAQELLNLVLAHVEERPGFTVGAQVMRPDGVKVALDRKDPLVTVGNVVAEDFCLLRADPRSGEYRLTAAVLCFPSRWLLSEKLGQALTEIHAPVPDYDDRLARRVGAVFAELRVSTPLVRINWLVHAVPELHLPMGHSDKLFQLADPTGPFYLRTERQTLRRMPETGAIAFGIKTSITPIANLTAEEANGLARALEGLDEAAMAYRAGAHVLGNAVLALDRVACGDPRGTPCSEKS